MLKFLNCYIRLYKKNKELKWELKKAKLEAATERMKREKDDQDYYDKRREFERVKDYLFAERRVLLHKLKQYEEV